MDITGHGKIGCNLKGGELNSVDKIDSQVSKINTNSIEYLPKTIVNK